MVFFHLNYNSIVLSLDGLVIRAGLAFVALVATPPVYPPAASCSSCFATQWVVCVAATTIAIPGL